LSARLGGKEEELVREAWLLGVVTVEVTVEDGDTG
jgi:hypothetical protein